MLVACVLVLGAANEWLGWQMPAHKLVGWAIGATLALLFIGRLLGAVCKARTYAVPASQPRCRRHRR
eukprot:COSAG01_NODE_49_length_31891_cov_29.945773_29_plen_67_part_00